MAFNFSHSMRAPYLSYRHEFVADAIIKAIMDIQLETRVPIIHSIMTPVTFHESGEHEAFFLDHFKQKGKETAKACLETIMNCVSNVNQ